MLSVSSNQHPAPSPASDNSPTPKASKRYHWSPAAAFMWVLVGFAVLPAIASVMLTVIPAILGWDSVRADTWLLESPVSNFLYVLLAGLLTLGALAWFIAHRKASFRQVMALKRPRWRDVGYAAAGAVVYFVLFVIAITVIDHILPLNMDQEQALGFERGAAGLGLLLAFVGLVVIPPVTEEMIFRGFFYGTLRAYHLSMVWATLFTSMVFASLHLFGAVDGNLLWVAFLDTFVLSLVLCYVREKTGSIWASIGLHALKNGFVFLNLFIINAT